MKKATLFCLAVLADLAPQHRERIAELEAEVEKDGKTAPRADKPSATITKPVPADKRGIVL